jgi:formylglycine-generating enzyme required for sulfatase activity
LAIALAAVGCSGSGEVAREPVQTATAREEPAPTATPVATASASAEPAPSATPSAAPKAVASAPPSFQGKCPAGMIEHGGGKFKSTYYRAELSVEPFCLDANLTSTDEYTACVESGKCDKGAVHACDPSTFNVEGRGKLPMICVDFMQAERYCKAQGKRVVSDLEWEWAARGGEEGREYPWGSEPPAEQLCWSGKEKRTMPCPVGTYAQGPKGVFDLVGNIYQWTTTTNDTVGTFRVGRGGSWKDGKADQVAVKRSGGFKNTYRCGFLGIRCSLPVP